jgi:hypothetical protein
VEYALRRGVEERPFDKAAWLRRAEYAQKVNDDQTRIASLISAVEADSGDLELAREVAFQLCRYVNEHKDEIPHARRGVYLASVRSHLEKGADQLDATGLSRLAWLYLLEGNQDMAWRYARAGLAKDENNRHCLRIVENLEGKGYGV